MPDKSDQKIVKVDLKREPGKTTGTVTTVDPKTGAEEHQSVEEARAEALKKRIDQRKAE